MKALLVGAGGMGRAWAKNLAESTRTNQVGWVDIRPGAAETAIGELNLTGVLGFEDLKTAIEATSPDFVVDVTIPEAHHDVTLTALAAGLPVLGEKPMAASMEQARAMVEASEKAGKLYMVSQSRRYDGRLVAFREIIEKVGRLGIVNADFYIGAHFGGFRDEMESVLLLDMAIHSFDQARAITGLAPVSVYAEEFNPHWSWYKGDACATCLFEFENDVRFTYRGSWCSEGSPTSWECDWRCVGENGTAIWDGHDAISADLVTKRGSFFSESEKVTTEAKSVIGGIAGSLAEFLDALERGETPQGECHDNILSLAMVFASLKSAREGRRVKISEIL